MLMGYGLMELCHLMSAHCYIDILKHFVVCPSIQTQTISISQSYFPSGVLLNLFLLHVCQQIITIWHNRHHYDSEHYMIMKMIVCLQSKSLQRVL